MISTGDFSVTRKVLLFAGCSKKKFMEKIFCIGFCSASKHLDFGFFIPSAIKLDFKSYFQIWLSNLDLDS